MLKKEQEIYGDLGPDYFWLLGKRRLIWALLRSYRDGNQTKEPVLDLGCGPGYALEELKLQERFVLGLDSSLEALGICRRRRQGTGAPLARARADHLPYRDHSLGLIVSLDLLEHVENDEAVLRECCRTLRPGGWLVLSVPAFRWLWGDHDTRFGHRRRYTVPELKEKLCRAGFKPVKVSYIQALFVIPLWILRRAKRLLPESLRPESDFIKVPRGLNGWLTRLIFSETFWLRRWDLPWGVSIVGICQKP